MKPEDHSIVTLSRAADAITFAQDFCKFKTNKETMQGAQVVAIMKEADADKLVIDEFTPDEV